MCEHRVERCDGVFLHVGGGSVVFADYLRHFGGRFHERAYVNSLRQGCVWQRALVECVVFYEIQGSRHVGYVAAECLIRVYGKLHPPEVKAVVGRKGLVDVGVFVQLVFLRREAGGRKALERFGAHGVHGVARVAANHVALRLE